MKNSAKKHPIEANFINRENRFVGIVEIAGKRHSVYIPNTGRLGELLIPGVRVLLSPSGGKYKYKMQYVIYKGNPVFIDSVECNRIFYELIQRGDIPALTGYHSVKREPPYKNHRFDFLLTGASSSNGMQELFVELKSCTLAWNNIASFPDAPTQRGVEHIKALSESRRGLIVFFILHSNIEYFIPNYHTSFEFYRTIMDYKDHIEMAAYSVEYGKNLEITGVKNVEIILPELKPKGCYLLVYENTANFTKDVGVLGSIRFPPGFYIYVGSGRNNLFKRIEHHRRKSRTKRWHLDYIKESFKLICDVPIVTERDIECSLADKMIELGGEGVSRFGSSDCACKSHLFYFSGNPIHRNDFWDMALKERFQDMAP